MNIHQLCEESHRIKFVAGFNARYHQILERRWRVCDRLIRIAVGSFAILGMWASVAGKDYAECASVIGWLSLIVAFVLNVFPTGDYEKFNGDMFRRWSELYTSVQVIQSKFEIENAKDASPEVRNRILEAIEIEHELHSSQPAPFRKLLAACESDELEVVYGKGIRTHAAAQKRLEEMSSLPVANSVCSATVPEVPAVVEAG